MFSSARILCYVVFLTDIHHNTCSMLVLIVVVIGTTKPFEVTNLCT